MMRIRRDGDARRDEMIKNEVKMTDENRSDPGEFSSRKK